MLATLTPLTWWITVADYADWITIGAAAATIAAVIAGFIRWIVRPLLQKWLVRRRGVSRPESYSTGHDRFVDRESELRELLERINSHHETWNLHGDRGIGKSELLKTFCDVLNDRLTSGAAPHLRRMQPNSFLRRYRALYFDVSDKTGMQAIIAELASRTFPDQPATHVGFVEGLNGTLGKKRPVLIVLDNLNNPALGFPLGRFIDQHAAYRPHDIFLIGSILPTILFTRGVNEIRLDAFTRREVKDFVRTKGIGEEHDTYDDAALEFSQGNPLFLDLFVHATKSTGALQRATLANSLETLVVDQALPNLSDVATETLIATAFLNLTSTEVSWGTVQVVEGRDIPPTVAEDLAKASLLHRRIGLEGQYVKVHDLVRDIIVRRYLHHARALNGRIADHYRRVGQPDAAAIHRLLSNERAKAPAATVKAIRGAIQHQNIAFLVTLADISTIGSGTDRESLPQELRTLLPYAQIYGVMSIGDYGRAREIARRTDFGPSGAKTITNAFSQDDLEFLFLLADLDHLQNRYPESVAQFTEIMRRADELGEEQLVARCLERLGHVYRHQHSYLDEAREYYLRAQQMAEAVSDEQTWVRARNGEISAALFNHDDSFDFEGAFEDVKTRCDGDPSLELLWLSTLKYKSIWLRSIGRLDEAHACALKAFEGFRSRGSRLMFNLIFELGEVARSQREEETAMRHYSRALDYAVSNRDRNLEHQCRLALLVSDLQRSLRGEESARQDALTRVVMWAREASARRVELQALAMLEIVGDNGEGPNHSRLLTELKRAGLKREAQVIQNPDSDGLAQLILTVL